MRRAPRFLRACFGMLALLLTLGTASAHEMTIAEMSLREVQAGQFVWAWGVPGKNRPIADDLRPVWPEGCQGDEATVRCGPKGMAGTLGVEGLGSNYSAAIVHVAWRGSEPRAYTLTPRQPRVQLYGAASDPRERLDVAATYALLGIEHILSGWDHLLFVLSLLLLVGIRRRLVATVTAFTLAHSVTLALSALGHLTLRPAPVEATIALSILLVCGEALRDRATLTRRWPALVAFLFGLVHGLGFAGALKEIGLPGNHVSIALVAFNAGVEVGQLAVIGLAFLVVLLARRVPRLAGARRQVLYAIGSLAAYWTIARLVALAG